MATNSRIYCVAPKAGGTPRLVRATHPAHALRHVADAAYDVSVADQETLVKLLGEGMAVESIKSEQTALPVDGE